MRSLCTVRPEERSQAYGIDVLWGVRGLAREIVAGAYEAGTSATRFFDSSDEAAAELIKEVKERRSDFGEGLTRRGDGQDRESAAGAVSVGGRRPELLNDL